MTHDELLAKIDYDIEGNPYDEYMSVLRTVVKLHMPIFEDSFDWCVECEIKSYPCPTIQTIEKELK